MLEHCYVVENSDGAVVGAMALHPRAEVFEIEDFHVRDVEHNAEALALLKRKLMEYLEKVETEVLCCPYAMRRLVEKPQLISGRRPPANVSLLSFACEYNIELSARYVRTPHIWPVRESLEKSFSFRRTEQQTWAFTNIASIMVNTLFSDEFCWASFENGPSKGWLRRVFFNNLIIAA